jgi:hypothetical protein
MLRWYSMGRSKQQCLTCRRPDRNSPRTLCGHSLPCPHHTVTVDLARDPITVTIQVNQYAPLSPVLDRLGRVADALRDGLGFPRNRKAGGGHG